MPLQTISVLKGWFSTGKKPLQAQFWDWLDSFWHKDSSIPQSSITNLVADLAALSGAGSPLTIEQTLTVPGSIAIPAEKLVDFVVVISGTAQNITIETVMNGGFPIDNQPIVSGRNLFQVNLYDEMTLYFRSFTQPVTIIIYTR